LYLGYPFPVAVVACKKDMIQTLHNKEYGG